MAEDRDADSLAALSGQVIGAPDGRTTYRIGPPIGRGGTAVAFLAERQSPEGRAQSVVKVTRPAFVRQSGEAAMLTVRKEATSLGLLNRQAPTPFVVRLLDVGSLAWGDATGPVDLPWLALEYVDGGRLGTTLVQRVVAAVATTGSAFDPFRAARAIDCLSRGLTAVHEIGVIHRDLHPMNVLCTGEGPEEVFKVTDFGIARPQGMETTFGGLLIGTPGYAAPELASYDDTMTGPWTDVFGLAALTFYVLTGEVYFKLSGPWDALSVIRAKDRRRLFDTARLSLALRQHPSTCEQLDALIAQATSPKRDQRPQRALDFAERCIALLAAAGASATHQTSDPQSRSVTHARPELDTPSNDVSVVASAWTFTHRVRAGALAQVRSAACADGVAMALSDQGLWSWDGGEWEPFAVAEPDPSVLRFVHPMQRGCWLLGGGLASLLVLRPDSDPTLVRGSDPSVVFEHASGDLDTVVVLAATRPGGPPFLQALGPKGWLTPVEIDHLASITALARTAPDRWLVTGCDARGHASFLQFAPLTQKITRLELAERLGAPRSATATTYGLLVITADGAVVHQHSLEFDVDRSLAGSQPTACALDGSGDPWIATRQGLFTRDRGRSQGSWKLVDPSVGRDDAVIVLSADALGLFALTSRGGVITATRG